MINTLTKISFSACGKTHFFPPFTPALRQKDAHIIPSKIQILNTVN
jgi:hypothetical protein